MDYLANLPHELFIRFLATIRSTAEELELFLENNGLAIPSLGYLDNILNTNKEYIELLTSLPVKDKAIEILQHKDREFIDVICVLYRDRPEKIVKELESYDIMLEKEVIETYQQLFWNAHAISSRSKWKTFLNGLSDEGGAGEYESISYKNLLKLAKLNDQELLFWKLQRPKTFKNKKDILEDAVVLYWTKLQETKYLPNNESSSKMMANYGNLLVNSIKQISELDAQTQYEDVKKMLEEGFVEIKSEKVEHKSLAEVVEENNKILSLPGNVVSLNGAKR